MTYQKTTPETFGRFVNWVYYHHLRDNQLLLPPTNVLIRLWTFAVDIQIPKLQNDAVRGLYERSNILRNGLYATSTYIYQNTEAGSPLRQLFVDEVARKVPHKTLAAWLQKYTTTVSVHLLADLVLAQRRILPAMVQPPQAVETYLVAQRREK